MNFSSNADWGGGLDADRPGGPTARRRAAPPAESASESRPSRGRGSSDLGQSGDRTGIGRTCRTGCKRSVAGFALWLLTQRKLVPAGLVCLGFIIAASPQLIASELLQSNPLYNQQAWNVAAGLANTNDLWVVANNVPTSVSLSQLAVSNPMGFVAHVAANLRGIIFEPQHWTGLYSYLFVLPALAWGFIRSRYDHRVSLLALCWLVYSVGVSLAFYNDRLLLPLVPITYLFAALMLLDWKVSRTWVLILIWILVALEVRWAAESGLTIPTRRSPETYAAASQILNGLGAFHPSVQVAALNPSCGGDAFYDLTDPLKAPAGTVLIPENDRSSADEFAIAVHKSGYRFIVLDECDIGEMPWLSGPLPAGLRWVYQSRDFRLIEVN